MLPTPKRGSLLAALVLSGALAGCLGDDGGPEGGPIDRATSAEVFRKLERRPLELPSVDLQGRSIREYGIAGRCFGEIEVGAIALPGIPGEAALGPWPGLKQLKRGPVYAALLAGPPRIVYLSGLPTVGQSRGRAVPTIWVSRPSYDGPVLVRGGRLERPGRLGFGSHAQPRTELRLPAGSWPRGDAPRAVQTPKGWRATGVPTRIRVPGCCAFQVDGQGFSYVLAFGVQSN
jgi:hypothetical protein